METIGKLRLWSLGFSEPGAGVQDPKPCQAVAPKLEP